MTIYYQYQIHTKSNSLRNLNSSLVVVNRDLEQSNETLVNKSHELENALEQLKNTQSKLIQNEKMATLGILAAGIAHEINNPLNFIKGGIEALSDIRDKNEDKNTGWLIDAINEGVSRVTAIVKSLSSFSRQNERTDEVCNLHKIINDCLLMAQGSMKNNIEVIKDFCDNKPIVLGNEGKLHQAFLNIVINALQAIVEEGSITIQTSDVKNYYIIKIVDTGIGIPKAHLPKIGEPFFTTKPSGEGTGLGLAMTFAIIEEHFGTLDISSKENVGTAITIKLPKHHKV
jgi:signal transduction histidine kinase